MLTMKINSYLLATSMLVAGLSAAVPAEAASTETQRFSVAKQQSGDNQNVANQNVANQNDANQNAANSNAANSNAANSNVQSAMAPSAEQDVGVAGTEDAVTVRSPGTHNDGFRTFQGWWKDD
jgi:hypothetical protein